MLQNYNMQIWWKVCRPLRYKYHLSVNCLMVLNGAYVYYNVLNKIPFTKRKLLNFMSYFSGNKLNVYLTVLIAKEFITLSGQLHNRDVYAISPLGLSVIKELNNSYEVELIKFCSLYSVVL